MYRYNEIIIEKKLQESYELLVQKRASFQEYIKNFLGEVLARQFIIASDNFLASEISGTRKSRIARTMTGIDDYSNFVKGYFSLIKENFGNPWGDDSEEEIIGMSFKVKIYPLLDNVYVRIFEDTEKNLLTNYLLEDANIKKYDKKHFYEESCEQDKKTLNRIHSFSLKNECDGLEMVFTDSYYISALENNYSDISSILDKVEEKRNPIYRAEILAIKHLLADYVNEQCKTSAYSNLDFIERFEILRSSFYQKYINDEFHDKYEEIYEKYKNRLYIL